MPLPTKNDPFRILLLATGGTISCTPGESGLAPGLTFKDFTDFLSREYPGISIQGVQLMNLDSANLVPENWMEMARAIQRFFQAYDAFLITHGTDTLSFTSAALSYLLRDICKPVILTGAQNPLGAENSDAIYNLRRSVEAACTVTGGVYVVFGRQVMHGTRVRKIHSVSGEGFIPLNEELSAVPPPHTCANKGFPPFPIHLQTNVSLVKTVPGIQPSLLRAAADHSAAVVIEAYGIGAVPVSLHSVVADLERAGKPVVIATQALHGGTHMDRYEIGQAILRYSNVIEGRYLSTECCLAKTMWALGMTENISEIRRILHTPISFDLG